MTSSVIISATIACFNILTQGRKYKCLIFNTKCEICRLNALFCLLCISTNFRQNSMKKRETEGVRVGSNLRINGTKWKKGWERDSPKTG